VNLPPGALMDDSLSPKTLLPRLHEGQSWSVPACNPLSPSEPLEILVAKVEQREMIEWNGELVDCWRVVCRSESGFSASAAPRGQIWVRHDGAVLKQELVLLDCRLLFMRISDDRAESLARKVQAARSASAAHDGNPE
jgi:hypothetical protein